MYQITWNSVSLHFCPYIGNSQKKKQPMDKLTEPGTSLSLCEDSE